MWLVGGGMLPWGASEDTVTGVRAKRLCAARFVFTN